MLNPKEFLEQIEAEQGFTEKESFRLDIMLFLSSYKNHILQDIIAFLELNEKKPVKSIVEELKGKV